MELFIYCRVFCDFPPKKLEIRIFKPRACLKKIFRGTDTKHWATTACTSEMISTSHDIIVMLISIIATKMDSIGTLNLLIRSSKSLRLAISNDARLLELVISNMPARTKLALCKLFVLPGNVALPCRMLPCPYSVFRLVPLCKVTDAFRHAVDIHGSVHGIATAFISRTRRSNAMKKVWKDKKDEMGRRWLARRRDIDQIHQDLFIIPTLSHTTTDAELYYMAHGLVKRLGLVYRGKRESPPVQVRPVNIPRSKSHSCSRTHGPTRGWLVAWDGQQLPSNRANRNDYTRNTYAR
jgi:hypothetical protein